MGVLSFTAVASPQVAATPAKNPAAPPITGDNLTGDDSDEEEEQEKKEKKKKKKKEHEAGDSEEDIPDPLSPTSRKVRYFGVKRQYDRKARNVLFKINQSPTIITANRAGELVVNGQAVPDSNFESLFGSVFSRTHDMEQPGIKQFLLALRQIGVRNKELSGRVVQKVYGSPLPPRGDAAARLAPFRGRVPAGAGADEEEKEGPNPDEEADRFVTPVAHRPRPVADAAAAPQRHGSKSATTQYRPLQPIVAAGKKASAASVSLPAAAAGTSSSGGKKQVGTGGVGVREMQPPPGKRPKILYVY